MDRKNYILSAVDLDGKELTSNRVYLKGFILGVYQKSGITYTLPAKIETKEYKHNLKTTISINTKQIIKTGGIILEKEGEISIITKK